MAAPVVWMKLAVQADRAVREALALLLVEWGAAGTVEEGEALCAFFPPEAREDIHQRLLRYEADLGAPVAWRWTAEVGERWRDAWKAHFRPARLSSRVAVCPSWETWTENAPDLRVIRMDPGRAFGTGTHETTRLCVGLIDRVLAEGPRGPFLDVGCGSGILSVAALLLGARRAVALDIDPLAAAATRENARANGVGDRIRVLCGDLRSVQGAYPLVAANILFPVLLGLAPALARCLAPTPEARLVLSGVLALELDPLARAYRALGLEEAGRETLGEWGALLCRPRTAG
ncbi:MAG: hypothetical protein Kow0092_38000 [Deferrisomatales bacterium]